MSAKQLVLIALALVVGACGLILVVNGGADLRVLSGLGLLLAAIAIVILAT